ncbi:MAG: SDR family oxidoreductase [Actinomyces sp.]|jgi:NADP-dependent 3-hydroxy acid dehydrogenase YdfG|nr:SDR family oxidoreductase [Actinomyces sp.]MCI1642259.1 SDR family oxidoreductase [Actinomyces sp.]MCI1662556.1 SDR family oxidoreductase [Actinomyces sp.]MCI1690933.1 SDR family oxidoreductase [Actinomyces sp.]MCI1788276.1 SDR family oxidoreductase [Actinomyces sp.]MCI1831081.1 SDR family oxidoreductase [Actinomyces sp.]
MTTQISLPLDGRVAVVTGASSGMGEATAEHLASLGAKVAVIARRADRLDGVVSRIQAAGGAALALAADVADIAAIQAAVDRVDAEFGGADLLFNNAGVMLFNAAETLDVQIAQRELDVNVTGVTNVIAAFTPQLIRSAEQRGVADIINTSSVGATSVLAAFSVYAASKAFVSHLSRNLRAELGAKKVRVSVIEPGLVDTELSEHLGNDQAKAAVEEFKQVMSLKPQDIAETVGFIASLPARVNLPHVGIMPTGQPA